MAQRFREEGGKNDFVERYIGRFVRASDANLDLNMSKWQRILNDMLAQATLAQAQAFLATVRPPIFRFEAGYFFTYRYLSAYSWFWLKRSMRDSLGKALRSLGWGPG